MLFGRRENGLPFAQLKFGSGHWASVLLGVFRKKQKKRKKTLSTERKKNDDISVRWMRLVLGRKKRQGGERKRERK